MSRRCWGEYLNLQAGRVYYAFERAGNVEEAEWRRTPLRWALDFNVDPMSSVVAQMDGEKVRVLDEIVLRRASTTKRARSLSSGTRSIRAGWWCMRTRPGRGSRRRERADVGEFEEVFESNVRMGT